MQTEHALIKDFPEKLEQLQKLHQANPAFARKAEAYEALAQRISSAENLDSTAIEALKQEHAALKNDISRDIKHASGSCCGGCGGSSPSNQARRHGGLTGH